MMQKKPKPHWLKKKFLNNTPINNDTKKIISNCNLHTVCQEAMCPNRLECFSKKCATFLALGKICTRKCSFCNVEHGKSPKNVDPKEPSNIAKAVKELQLKHVVITMVTRDDLSDGGASHLIKIVDEIRDQNKDVTIELLTSDFNMNFQSLDIVLDKNIDIFNHNLETVEKLTPKIRSKASYQNSLKILKYAKDSSKTSFGQSRFTKSGIMVGLGETKAEVFQTLKDLKAINIDIVTIGQYLQPTSKNIKVFEYVHPKVFKEYEKFAKSIGISKILSSPYVRSSYNAAAFL
jgi:lipoyl synthase